MSTEPRVSPPRRGTRPSNRRELILAAARELFFLHGYDQIGVSEIADAVAIGPSALYRHFPGKQRILAEVLTRELTMIRTRLDRLDGLGHDETLLELASIAVDHRPAGVLIQREARHLPEAERAMLRQGTRDLGRGVRGFVSRARPEMSEAGAEMLARAAVGIMVSPTVLRVDLPQDEYESILRELVAIVLASPVPADYALAERPPPDAEPPVRFRSRREHLLSEAVRLFAARGYANVAVEDIAAALGIAGPSVYNHFPSKLDLLLVPMERGIAYLMLDLSEIVAAATDPHDALRRLIRSYTGFAVAHHQLIDLLFGEIRHLPDERRATLRFAQSEYLKEWAALLAVVSPGLGPTAVRIRVQATITMVNDIARTPHLRTGGVVEILVGICDRLLLEPS